MSWAASLPGAELFSRNHFFEEATCPRQLQNFSEKRTFRNSRTPVRRTRRRKSKKMHCQEFWDSCAQNKTSKITKTTLSGNLELRKSQKNALSGNLGLLCAEQNVGNFKNELSGIPGLLCAEQDVGNLKKMHFQELWDSCAQNKTSEI